MKKQDRLEYQKKVRSLNGNAFTKKYEKTKKGFLMRLYRNMQSRIVGVQKQKHHLYSGKYLLPREKFYEWALSNQAFNDLFETWEKSSYCRKLTPSVDRINSTLGYEVENMEWVTHSENSRRGAVSLQRLTRNYRKNLGHGKISKTKLGVTDEQSCNSSE